MELTKNFNMGGLSKSFDAKEFFKEDTYQFIKECKHEPKWHIDQELVKRLQLIRDYFNKPVHITSGYRTMAENIVAGSTSKFSLHQEGKAADIVVEGIDPSEVQEFYEKNFNSGGLGKGKDFTHVDCRNSDKLIIWKY